MSSRLIEINTGCGAPRDHTAADIEHEAIMGYRTMLAHVDNGNQRAVRLDLAFSLAREFDAHFLGCMC